MLETIGNTHKPLDMDQFLSGVPYDRPTQYKCNDIDNYGGNVVVHITEYIDRSGNDAKSDIYQLYDSTGRFQNELVVPAENESDRYYLTKSDNALRLFKWNDDKMIIYDVVEE